MKTKITIYKLDALLVRSNQYQVFTMPRRTGNGLGQGFDPLITGSIYHVYSRTIGGVEIFTENDAKFADLFLAIMRHCHKYSTSYSQHRKKIKLNGDEFFRLPASITPSDKPKDVIPVKIHAYTIMPNHFHLIVEQLVDDGISFYIGRLLKGFSKIYNKEVGRKGALWEGKFRAKLIADEESYRQVIRDIHLNPIKSSRLSVTALEDYEYSSYPDAIGKRNNWLCDHTMLQNMFNSPMEYEKFVHSQVEEGEEGLVASLSIEELFAN